MGLLLPVSTLGGLYALAIKSMVSAGRTPGEYLLLAGYSATIGLPAGFTVVVPVLGWLPPRRVLIATLLLLGVAQWGGRFRLDSLGCMVEEAVEEYNMGSVR